MAVSIGKGTEMTNERIVLGDDGTLDTVVYCRECGREYRGTFDGQGSDIFVSHSIETEYANFVEYLIESVEEDHICESEEGN